MGGIFLPAAARPGEEVPVDPDDAHHVMRVLRLRPGDRLWVGDGAGRETEAVVSRMEGGRVWVVPEAWRDAPAEPRVRVTLAQAIPKGDRMDWLVQKAAEVGVYRIIPLITRRSVVKPSPKEGGGGRPERWQRIARESARQVLRARIPQIERPAPFPDVLARIREDGGARAFMPWEELPPLTLRDVLLNDPPSPDVYIFIGPEGGWEPAEVEAARQAGVEPVNLGPRILRSETAGLVALTLVVALWGAAS